MSGVPVEHSATGFDVVNKLLNYTETIWLVRDSDLLARCLVEPDAESDGGYCAFVFLKSVTVASVLWPKRRP